MEFKIGDLVKVTNSKQTFDFYQSMAQKLGLTKWNQGKLAAEGTYGKVIATAPHEYCNDTVVAITVGEQEYMVSDLGLELAAVQLPDEFILISANDGEYPTKLEAHGYRVYSPDGEPEHSCLYGFSRDSQITVSNVDFMVRNIVNGTWKTKETKKQRKLPETFKFKLDEGCTGCWTVTTLDDGYNAVYEDGFNVFWDDKSTSSDKLEELLLTGVWLLVEEPKKRSLPDTFTFKVYDSLWDVERVENGYNAVIRSGGSVFWKDEADGSNQLEYMIEIGSYVLVDEKPPTEFEKRLAYFQTHIDAVQENLDSLKDALEELKQSAQ